MMRPLLAGLLISLALPASAQIYKYIDAQGNTVFTDQPPDGQAAQSIELAPTNSLDMQVPNLPPVDAPASSSTAPHYKTLQLIDVPTDDAIRANNGNFSVGVQIEPRLAPGHRLRLLLDGEPHGQPSNVPRLQLSNVERGEHSLAVEVLSGDKSVQLSPTVTFTVQRVHTGSPALRPPPAKPAP